MAHRILGRQVRLGRPGPLRGLPDAASGPGFATSAGLLSWASGSGRALGDLDLRPTDSQATAVWGDPAAVVLRCGAEVPGPTTDRCISVDGIDWVIRDEDENWRITTYGRDPAVEVLFGKDQASSDTVMVGLSSAVAQIESSGGCVSVQDATPVG